MPAHKRDSGREREDREEKRKGPGESACVCVFVFIRSDKILFSKNVSVSFLALFQAMLRQEHQDGHFFYSTLVLPSCAVLLLLGPSHRPAPPSHPLLHCHLQSWQVFKKHAGKMARVQSTPIHAPPWFPTGISRVLSPPSPPPPSYLVTVIPLGPQLSPAPGLGGALQGKTQKHGRIAPVRVAGIPVPGVPMTKA